MIKWLIKHVFHFGMWKMHFCFCLWHHLCCCRCLWILPGFTLSLLLLYWPLFLFIDGLSGMFAAKGLLFSWKILPVEPIPNRKSLKSHDMPQSQDVSCSKHTSAVPPCSVGFKPNHRQTHNVNTHAHKAPISSQSPASLSTHLHPPSFHLFSFFYVLICISVCLERCIFSAGILCSSFDHLFPFVSMH